MAKPLCPTVPLSNMGTRYRLILQCQLVKTCAPFVILKILFSRTFLFGHPCMPITPNYPVKFGYCLEHFCKIFPREMSNKSLHKTLLQILIEVMLKFKVIFKYIEIQKTMLRNPPGRNRLRVQAGVVCITVLVILRLMGVVTGGVISINTDSANRIGYQQTLGHTHAFS